MPASEAVSPAGISSFFEICKTDADGNVISDPARIGARGGGFGIDREIHARVIARKARRKRVEIRINSDPSPEARTTRWALTHILESAQSSFEVQANITLTVPIGSGFGTSAAGTAAACLALSDALDLSITYNEVGRIAHVADVINGTGLGTAGALLVGGFVLATQPGAPGIGQIDRLIFPKDHSILCAYLGPIPTKQALSQVDVENRVNPSAQRAMAAIRERPNLQTFLDEACKFSREAGFQTPDVSRLIAFLISNGASGAAQNMLGNAVHAVAEKSKISKIAKVARKALPRASIFTANLEERGVRLV